MKRLVLILTVLTFALVSLGTNFGMGVAVSQAKPLKIRIAKSVAAPHAMIALLFEDPKAVGMKHYGKSYVVDRILFRGTSPQIQALAAKQLDVGYLAYASFPFAIIKGHLDIKIVADLLQDKKGWLGTNFTVLKSSPIKTAEDFRGKTIGVNLFNTAVSISLRVKMLQYGMLPKRDYNIVEVNFPSQEAFLREGKIDVACLPGPFWHRANGKGDVRKIFATAEATGDTNTLITVARTDWLKKHPKVAQHFFDDWLTAWKWYKDPANREKALDLTVKHTKRSRKAYWWAFSKNSAWLDPDGIPNLEGTQRSIDMMSKLGILKQKFDISPHVDLSWIKKAKENL